MAFGDRQKVRHFPAQHTGLRYMPGLLRYRGWPSSALIRDKTTVLDDRHALAVYGGKISTAPPSNTSLSPSANTGIRWLSSIAITSAWLSVLSGPLPAALSLVLAAPSLADAAATWRRESATASDCRHRSASNKHGR